MWNSPRGIGQALLSSGYRAKTSRFLAQGLGAHPIEGLVPFPNQDLRRWYGPDGLRGTGLPFLLLLLGVSFTGIGGCSDEVGSPNRPPGIIDLYLEPSTVAVDSMVTVTVVADDPDDEVLAYSWRASAGSFPAGDSGWTVRWDAPGVAQVCTLWVEVSDGSAVVADSIEVIVQEPGEGLPCLERAPVRFVFNIAKDRATFPISNCGGGVLHWTVNANADWISVEPGGGMTIQEEDLVTIEIDRSGLVHGRTLTGRVDVASDGGNHSVYLEVHVVKEPVFSYRIVDSYPHDPEAYTQGLVFHDEWLYESTGLYSSSSLRRVELTTGVVQQEHLLDDEYFGEGLTVWGDTLIQLTWRNGTGIIYDRDSFVETGRIAYAGEGWGLTQDGREWIMSDGSNSLRFLNPVTGQEAHRITVTTSAGVQIPDLNELEYIAGEVYANIWNRRAPWLSEYIVRIDPDSGHVVGWIDLTDILEGVEGSESADVLNGIAFDPDEARLFVTGKLWPRLFEIELISRQ